MNKSKNRGTAAETAVVRYLHEQGFPQVERRALNGNADRGDIAGLVGIVLEVKCCRTMALGQWMNEAQVEKQNDDADIAAVVHKRVGKGSPADWYCTLNGADFTELLRRAGY